MERINPECKWFMQEDDNGGPGAYHTNICLAGYMNGDDCSSCDRYVRESIKNGKGTTIERMRNYFGDFN